MVPASNLYGIGAYVEPVIVTVSIISPPPRNGGSSSSSSRRPQSTPIPVGPHILCPVNAKKSAPSAATSTGICGTAWEPSTTTSAPTSCARAATAATGLSVPSVFDTCTSDTTLVRCVIRSSTVDRSSRPSSVMPNQRRVAPVRSASSCHGTMLEWCSISVMTISSPGPTW